MKEYCPRCDTQLVPHAAFCHACGEELPAEDQRPSRGRRRRRDVGAREATDVKRKRRTRRKVRASQAVDRGAASVSAKSRRTRPAERLHPDQRPSIRAEDDQPEEELWNDTFSAKGFVNYWCAAVVVTVGLVILSSKATATEAAWQLTGVVLGAMWLGLLGWIVVLKMDVYYTLTTQRLLHQSGILTRHTRRIEVIDIDDVSYRQGLLERFLGVGTLEIVSSDVTDPIFELPAIDRVHEVAEMIDEVRRAERLRRGLHIEAV